MRPRLFAAAVLAAAVISVGRSGLEAQSQPAATALARARELYNTQQYDAAIEAADEARKVPALANTAALIYARAHLERFRGGGNVEDLAIARDALKQIYATSLTARDQIEFLIALGESLYLEGCEDGCYSASAEMFDEALSRGTALSPAERDQVFEWWAASLDRVAQVSPAADSRRSVYARILTRSESEITRVEPSPSALYWLAAASRGTGDFERAWGAAIAGYVRARFLGPRGTTLRADLDKLVREVLLPERARQLTPEGDARPLLAQLLEQWEDLKKRWG